MSLKLVLNNLHERLQETPVLGIGRSRDVPENGHEIPWQTAGKKLVDFNVDINPIQKIGIVVFVPDKRQENDCCVRMCLK